MKAEVRNPSGALTDCLVKDNADGTYNVEYTPFENGNTHTHTLNKKLYRTPSLSSTSIICLSCISGVHNVQVLYDNTPVPKSPFRVSVAEGCDPSRVVATGPGLQQALTEKPNNFNIITRYCW